MEVEKTLRPGADGTAKYVNRFGDRLVCVRHRLDRQANKRYTTVELIPEERERTARHVRPYRAGPDNVCLLRVQAHERAMIALIRRGQWPLGTPNTHLACERHGSRAALSVGSGSKAAAAYIWAIDLAMTQM